MLTNYNYDRRLVCDNGVRISDDGENFIQALDEGVEELIDTSYGIYNI